eukprot:scaffold67303_cov21-Prasinocladus_malaysianus.AAC.1
MNCVCRFCAAVALAAQAQAVVMGVYCWQSRHCNAFSEYMTPSYGLTRGLALFELVNKHIP